MDYAEWTGAEAGVHPEAFSEGQGVGNRKVGAWEGHRCRQNGEEQPDRRARRPCRALTCILGEIQRH